MQNTRTGTMRKDAFLGSTRGLPVFLAIIMVVILGFTTGAWAWNIDSSGGDCDSIGTWDLPTCTLNTNVTETIKITADNITLNGNGHTLTGSGDDYHGVEIVDINNVTVENLHITGLGFSGLSAGIFISGGGNHTLENNTLTENTYGIIVQDSEGNTISGNEANFNYNGIVINSPNNDLINNKANYNSIIGISIYQSYNNLTGNTANWNAKKGIYLDNASDNNLVDNTANNNRWWSGIVLEGNSNNNTLSGNTANDNGEDGIRLDKGPSNNTISGNTVSSNISGHGIRLLSSIFGGGSSTGNTIYHNNIMQKVSDSKPGSNDWHEPELLEGNYWFDYAGVDDGSDDRVADDGIGDTEIPHPAAYFDNYPFMNSNGWEKSDLELICELKVDHKKTKLHFETYNTDLALLEIWPSLFDAVPGDGDDNILILQGHERIVTWAAGTLEMGGTMELKVKSDKKDPGHKKLTISKAKKKNGTTEFFSGTGGLNPNVADGGWHEVKIKNLDNVTVTVTVDEEPVAVTGFLKELKVKLDKDSLTDAPIVKDFKLKLEGDLAIPDVKKGTASNVVIKAPASTVIAIGGTEYEEKIKDRPEEVLGGHSEAEFEGEYGVDLSPLEDDFNNYELKERKGPCSVSTEPS